MINISITSRSTRSLQKIAKTKLKPHVWVFDWRESCLESTLDLDSAALAFDTISPIVRAFSEGLASAGGWTPLPFAFSSGQETPTSPLFFFFLNPCWDLNPLRRVLGDERLLGRRKGKGYKRRKSSWILSDIFYMQKETSTIEVLMEL